MDYYLLKGDGDQTGPYSLDQLRAMWASGQVTLDMAYWHEGMTEWQTMRALEAALRPVKSHSKGKKMAWMLVVLLGIVSLFLLVAATVTFRSYSKSTLATAAAPLMASASASSTSPTIHLEDNREKLSGSTGIPLAFPPDTFAFKSMEIATDFMNQLNQVDTSPAIDGLKATIENSDSEQDRKDASKQLNIVIQLNCVNLMINFQSQGNAILLETGDYPLVWASAPGGDADIPSMRIVEIRAKNENYYVIYGFKMPLGNESIDPPAQAVLNVDLSGSSTAPQYIMALRDGHYEMVMLTRKLTKQQWRSKAPNARLIALVGHISCSKQALNTAVGQPDRTEAEGPQTYLYWDCSDGGIKVSCSPGTFQAGIVDGDVNDY